MALEIKMISILLICISLAHFAVGTTNLNVLDEKLEVCSLSPVTGFQRTGYCQTDENDYGTHLVCAKVNDKFLEYTKSKGNDLSTPTDYFPGLKSGDNWCLCVYRWSQAKDDGFAPPVVLESTNKEALHFLKELKKDINDLY